jgi:hypothetical protein
MRPLLGPVALLVACGGSPAEAPPSERPSAERVDGTPDVGQLETWLRGTGRAVERVDEVLRLRHAAADGDYGIVVQPMAADHVVWLTTEPLLRLRDAAGDRGVTLLLTNMAVLNYETLEGKLQLDPRSGGIVLSIELPTDDGLGKATLIDAVSTLERNADALRPKLLTAAQGASL